MYAPFFGLNQEPFSIAPDPRYLFMSERHREALAHLLYGAQGGGGFVLLTGEIGAGKTTICRCFMEQVPSHCHVAYIFNPRLTVIELLRSVCDDFGIEYPRQEAGAVLTIKDYIDPLNAFLLRTHAQGQSNILIIDEAQMLPADVLEQLRLLTNLETSERKLLQIMLIGQPELREMLERPELEQLAQRVIARFHLSALDAGETFQYIHHRLAVAGLKTASPFTPEAVKRIQRWTRGVPRRINLLCDRAMLGAYAQGLAQIDQATVDQAAHEVFGRLLKQQTRQGASERPSSSVAAASEEKAASSWAQAIGKNRWTKALLWALAGMGTAAIVTAGVLIWKTPTVQVTEASPALPSAVAPQNAQPANGSNSAIHAATQATGTSGVAVSAWSPTLSGASAATASSSEAAVATTASASSASAIPAAPIRDENQAWAALGALWHTDLGTQAPCEAATAAKLACFRSQDGLSVIQRLGRPGLITLRDDRGQTTHALITGLGPQSATVRMAGTSQTLSLSTLARIWQGDFATLWITPPDYQRKLVRGSKGPAVDWLATRLATVRGEPAPAAGQRFDAELQAKVLAFQLTQGLKPDGVAGSTTLMLLNRATGVVEPRLSSEP